MKARITKAGELQIWRGNEFKHMMCPYNKDKYCKDTCPLFSEPMPCDKYVDMVLCKTELSILSEDFEDARSKK